MIPGISHQNARDPGKEFPRFGRKIRFDVPFVSEEEMNRRSDFQLITCPGDTGERVHDPPRFPFQRREIAPHQGGFAVLLQDASNEEIPLDTEYDCVAGCPQLHGGILLFDAENPGEKTADVRTEIRQKGRQRDAPE